MKTFRTPEGVWVEIVGWEDECLRFNIWNYPWKGDTRFWCKLSRDGKMEFFPLDLLTPEGYHSTHKEIKNTSLITHLKEFVYKYVVGSEPRVEVKRESNSRCDYIIKNLIWNGEFRDYYLYGMRDGFVRIHYLDTTQEPPRDEGMAAMEFLRQKKGNVSSARKCFGWDL